jgi:hypothetical protein
VLPIKLVNIILSKQFTHIITVCDCGDNQNHINDYARQEEGQDC